MVFTFGREPKLGLIDSEIMEHVHQYLYNTVSIPFPGLAGISTPESLPDITPVSPMDPKLLEDDGLVLEEGLLEVADGGLPLPALNSSFPDPGRDLT